MSAPVYVLGVSAYYHDSAACLLRDGVIVAADAPRVQVDALLLLSPDAV